MEIRSLGYRTDLLFHRFDGLVTDRGDHLVVRTPSNTDYYHGNFLLFDGPPAKGDLDRWSDLFRREIGAPPEARHVVFGWDSPAGEMGDVQPFLDAGFRAFRYVVLTARTVGAPPHLAEADCRPIRTDAEWRMAVENQVACRDAEFREEDYRAFAERRMARYRAMAADGLGHWFGAFVEGRLAADLGLFHDGAAARYQSVQTHPDFRRRGIAGTLVVESARRTIQNAGIESLVIVAGEGEPAERLYRGLGFQPTEFQVGVEKWPEMSPDGEAG